MPWPDLPPPNTLLPFEATVRHGSMTAAAQELHVTHGAVSRQIQNLERALGTTLFERAPRSLRPTPEARRLAADWPPSKANRSTGSTRPRAWPHADRTPAAP
ncbi:LysR family transcriptional regulator [Streptomyces sp. NPDC058067]|uniref:helix-turn-helix domain-containing protein n=1 Tax=Streptomyces sp. NPDC058067 TaxID=3346324 RepID=UPI0036EFAEF7